MTHFDDELGRALDRALDEIRAERPAASFEQAATGRVWQELERELGAGARERARAQRIESCTDFQAMLPSYLARQLAAGRLLLLEDHLGECVPCRRALKTLRAEGQPLLEPRNVPSASWAERTTWRVAVAAAILLAVVGFSWKTDLFSFESGGLIRIEAVEGELFHVTGEGAVPLQVGDVLTLDGGDGLLTAKGSSAVLALADASRVELRERSQLGVRQLNHPFPGRRPDGLLDLERGSIIVEASDQGSGHLRVGTRACNVSVTGTIFAMTHGVKGSRVSVVEGEVRVSHRGNLEVLLPGDQTTTDESLAALPIEREIAWSRNSAQYVALLREMRALGREIDAALQPELRYDTDLLDLAPAGTVVYFTMPNLSDELGRAFEILQDRVSTSVVLRDWWEQHVLASGGGDRIAEIIEKIRTVGEQLGEEIVMTLQLGADGEISAPLFLAQSKDRESLVRALSGEVDRLQAEHGPGLGVRLLGDRLSTLAPLPADVELYVWTSGEIVALSPRYETLWALDAALQGRAGATLAGSAFHDRLRESYRDGVEWAVGVDVQRLFGVDPTQQRQLEEWGLLDLEHLIGEHKHAGRWTENRVVLTFDQPRRRLASWIAEPAPMGALDYVGPDANLVGAFVMKDMRLMVDELFQMIGARQEDFESSLADFEREERIDVRRDFAAPLGGELAVALDGPALPTPSWKVILEVYDPARLLQSVEWLVERLNREAADAGAAQKLELTRDKVGKREYFRLELLETGLGLHFVFDGGYLVAGPSRGLLDRALQNRAAGIKLADAPAFRALLPRDEQVNFSGILYQNMGSILGPLSGTVDSLADMTGDERELVKALAAEARPSLALLYGERDRIILTSSSEGGLFSSLLSQLSGAGSLLGIQSLAQALEQEVGGR